MFHHSVPQNERDILLRSPLNFPCKALYARFDSKLQVLQYHKAWNGSEMALLGTVNGAHVGAIHYQQQTPTKYSCKIFDSSFLSIEQSSARDQLNTASDRYFIKKLTDRHSKPCQVINAVLEERGRSDLRHPLSAGVSIWKSKVNTEAPVSNFDTRDIYELLEVLNSEKEKIEMSTTLIDKANNFYTSYKTYKDRRDNATNDYTAMFKDKHKWVIICSRLAGNAADQYYIGAVDTNPIYKALVLEGVNDLTELVRTLPIVVPFDTYRSVNDFTHDGMRDSMLGTLSMLKLFTKANHDASAMYDKDGFIPATHIYEPSLGYISVTANRSFKNHMIMFDK